MPRRTIVAILATLVVLGAVLVPSLAAEPESSTLATPSAPGMASTAWTGAVQPGASGAGTNDCSVGGPENDTHTITFTVPADTSGITYSLQVAIAWEPNAGSANDLVLSVFRQTEDGGRAQVGSSDGGSPMESLTLAEPPAGTYEVVACGFANATPQDYEGSATVTTDATETVQLPPAADDAGLEFSATVPADIQRDEGEPIVEIDEQGNIYTCGPTGFSQAEDYLQVSTDGGDQFHLLGEPPRGQQSAGGGGDCGLATAPEENDEGFHTLSYIGLSGLLEFTTARSTDVGRTFLSSPSSESGPAVDRQWIGAGGTDTVFLNFNRVAPRDITVQRSDDGGLTYSPPEPISPNPGFPGPVKTLPPELNPADNGELAVYYPWTQGTSLRLAVSLDGGDTWNNCTAAEAEGNPGAQFPVADHDLEGNLYIAYTDQANFNTFIVTAPNDALTNCDGNAGSQLAITLDDAAKSNPGFSPPKLVNREGIPTTVFPWLAAGGEPGRVAVSFYGSPTLGRPDATDLPHTWHVYVNQSLDALADDPDFSQVRATTHPNHFGQICLLGLGCTAGGDRSLVDFFAIDHNPANGELSVVYNTAHKRPGDVAGTVSTPQFLHQIAGPSNSGGDLDTDEPTVLRSSSVDPTGDALADYSSLGDPGRRTEIPALDVTGVTVRRERDLQADDGTTNEDPPLVDDGGFTVTIDVDDLSDAALQAAAFDAQAQSLLWIFRYVDGFRYSAVSARWNPVQGFTFGHNGYVATVSECGSPSLPDNPAAANDQCLLYPGGTPVEGTVDQEAGEIRLSVSRELLVALEGGEGRGEQPVEVPAEAGDRLYDAAVFAVSNTTSPTQDTQAFLYPIDNTPAMDFLVPGPEATDEDPDVIPIDPDTDPDTDPPTDEPGPPELERFAGGDRIDTAADIAVRDRSSADVAVLARADVYADALAGGPLAVDLDAPLLLSASDALSPRTAEVIEELDVTEVVLLGGPVALSDEVEQDLEDLGVTTRRVAGADRFATAVEIRDELPDSDEVFLAEGDDADPTRGFPDALSAAGLASNEIIPILLTLTDEVPGPTADALSADLDVTIVGGPVAVSEAVEATVDDRTATVRRLAGATRYGTSVAVAEEALDRGVDPGIVWIATGENFPDGLVAGAAAGADGALLVLVDGSDADGAPESLDFLAELSGSVELVRLAGGPDAIADAVVDAVEDAVDR